MCGIVIMGCKYPGARDVDLFEELLFADTFRGPHSTGVHSLFQLVDKGEIITETQKKQLDGPSFIASNLWPMVAEKRTPGLTANSTIVKRPFCMIGHNRWATKGGINDTNAHPFTHGHITMVHNGTLRNQSLLPEHTKFEVDSDNVAYALSVWGVEKTIQNLNGAFTLVWHDSKEQTVNIIRNSERPFHLARTTTGDWFGASEAAMLKWILARQKTPVAIAESFECEVGVQYIFDVSTGKFLPKENVKHTLPTFRYVYQSYASSSTSYSGYDDEYDYDAWWTERRTYNSQTRQASQGPSRTSVTDLKSARAKKEMEDLLWNHGISKGIGDTVNFNANDFTSYKGSQYGEMVGYLDTKEYVGTICHGVDSKLYRQFGDYSGTIVKAEVESGTLYVTISKPKLMNSEDSEEPNPNEAPVVGEVLEFKITGIDTVKRQWTGETPTGFKTYGDWYHAHSHMEVGAIWAGRSVIQIDKMYRIADVHKRVSVSGKVVGEIKEGEDVKFRVTTVNLGTSSFEGLTDTNKRVSGSVPNGIFMNIGEDWEATVSFRFYDDSYRVKDVRKPGLKSTSQLLAEVAAMDDEEVGGDDEVVGVTATGDRFTEKKWKESLVSDCCACSSPISFKDIGTAVLMQGWTFCKDCADAEPPFEVSTPRPPLAKDENYFICGECGQRKHVSVRAGLGALCHQCDGKRSRVQRPVLSLPRLATKDLGKVVDFMVTQLAAGPAFWGKTRTDLSVSGVIPTGMEVKVGDMLQGRIDREFVDGSYRLCNVTKKQEVISITAKVVYTKTLSNGISVSKELWETKMCKCKMCGNPIPWAQADLVSLVGGVPVCADCTKLIV